jgi:tRNA-splicing ligase RtcB
MKNIFGTHDEKTLAQLSDVGSRAERVALMADGHLGYVMPIGGVAAYRNQVSVVGVGFDIACGNAALLSKPTAPRVLCEHAYPPRLNAAKVRNSAAKSAIKPTVRTLTRYCLDST